MKLAEDEVMAFPRKLVEHVILGLYDQINIHLVKLAGFDFSPELRRHSRGELDTWLTRIRSLRFKPNNRTGSYKFYFDLLFDYPFGGVEIENMRRIMSFIVRASIPTRDQPKRRKKWSTGCANFIRSWPSVCMMAKTCSI
jgi:hypothetical protein